MIRQLSFDNFYSIAQKQKISFCVNGNAPSTSDYVQTPFNDRISKINLIFGANASGKTNTLKVLSFLSYFITAPPPNNLDEKIEYESYWFSKTFIDKITNIDVEFFHDDRIYEYSLSFTAERVYHESLREKAKDKYIEYIFRKKWHEKTKEYTLRSKYFGKSEDYLRAFRRKNASVIAIGAQLSNPKCLSIAKYWNKAMTNVGIYGKPPQNRWTDVKKAAKYFYIHEEEKRLADRLISEFDLGLSETKIEKEHRQDSTKKEIEDYFISGVHSIGKTKLRLPFFFESTGTQNLYIILRDILPALREGGVVVYDDIEYGLHPMMMPKLIELFASENWNPKNAQLIASTHNIQLLDRLDMYQIFLTEKNNGRTSVWRLDDVDDIRTDSNYLKKYLAGAYGGRPNV